MTSPSLPRNGGSPGATRDCPHGPGEHASWTQREDHSAGATSKVGSPTLTAECVPLPPRFHVDRDALLELEAALRLLFDLDEILRVYAVSDELRHRIAERTAAIETTLRREWRLKKGGKALALELCHA